MPRLAVNTPLAVSVGSIAVAALVVVGQLPALAAALLTPGLRQDPTSARLAESLQSHAEDLATYRDRFNGRSLFVMPRPPVTRPTPPPPQMPIVKAEEPPAPAPAPSSYSGPGVLFVLGDEVWFGAKVTRGSQRGMPLRLRVGQEGEGVRVIESDPPWSVRLGHSGGEYDVPLFNRDYSALETGLPPQTRRSIPGLEFVEVPEDAEPASAHEQPDREQPQ